MKKIGQKAGNSQYILQSVLGQGSYGKVYYSPPYAIKEMKISSHMHKAIKNQTSILRTLNHPNIVKLFDIFQEDSSLFLVMEYCEMDLSQYLRKFKLGQQKAIEIIKQISSGLNCLYQHGFTHRDLKPANILVKNMNQFKLADFGMARHVPEYDSSMLQSIVGTPLYMAPQILRKEAYTTKCDIWSAGIIFYEVLLGQAPWKASSQAQLYQQVVKTPLNLPNSISQASKHILSRMIVVNEIDRIGWEDFFQLVKNYAKGPIVQARTSRSKEKRPTSASSQTNLSKECLSYPAHKLKEILLLDMQDYFDERTINKIVKEPQYKPNAQQCAKIREILSLYNAQLQAWFLKDVPSFRLSIE